MSHVPKPKENIIYTPKQREKILQEPRWQYCKNQVNPKVLEKNFNFLNQAVVLRGDAQGIPLMMTTGIYGPIDIHDTVSLKQNPKRIVEYINNKPICLLRRF